MKAAVYQHYGEPESVLRIPEVTAPTPAGDEVLVRVRAATVTAAGAAFLTGRPWFARLYAGLRRPQRPILGIEFAGEVVATGQDVARFRAGDAVFGRVSGQAGTHAELVCVKEAGAILPMPASLSFAEAAAAVDSTALYFLRDKANLRAGQSILINGATGGVGAAATQLAKRYGATVTAVCGPRTLDVARALGADRTLDYTRDDFTRDGSQYDVIFDVAAKSDFRQAERALTPTGIYLTTAPSPGILLAMARTARGRGRKAAVAFAGLRPETVAREDLAVIAELTERGDFRPVVDRCFPLDQIAAAYRHRAESRQGGTTIVEPVAA